MSAIVNDESKIPSNLRCENKWCLNESDGHAGYCEGCFAMEEDKAELEYEYEEADKQPDPELSRVRFLTYKLANYKYSPDPYNQDKLQKFMDSYETD